MPLLSPSPASCCSFWAVCAPWGPCCTPSPSHVSPARPSPPCLLSGFFSVLPPGGVAHGDPGPVVVLPARRTQLCELRQASSLPSFPSQSLLENWDDTCAADLSVLFQGSNGLRLGKHLTKHMCPAVHVGLPRGPLPTPHPQLPLWWLPASTVTSGCS